MRHLYAAALLAAAIVAVLVLAGTAAGNHRPNHLETTLVGSEEVPGPGDSDGSGRVDLRVRPRLGKICFEFTVTNVATITAAHIHKAPAGMAGPIVVDLSPVPPDADDGHWQGCKTGLDHALVRDIKLNHVGYYVNVHNGPFPSGALRGQLD
jgi:CHRD domain